MTLSKGEIPDMWSGETAIKQGVYKQALSAEDTDTEALEVPWPSKYTKTVEVKINLNKEENTMNTRKIVNIHLIDDSLGLPVEKSIVAIYEGIVTEDSQEVTIQQLLMDKDVKGAIAAHNEARTNIVDNAILERTGNSVMLRPVTLKDLRWDVK